MIPSISLRPVRHILRVLCVDDNPDHADSEALFLRILGFETLACYGGREAIVLAGAFLPDVCLLDMNMPGMEGDELAVRLRNWAGGRPLVLVAVTASCNDPLAAGFDRHLLKPVDPHRLAAVIDALGRSIQVSLAEPSPRRQASPV